MGIGDELERRLEKVVEGAFSKAFKSDVQPSELGRRMLLEMERGKTVSVGAVYVPNDFTIQLSSKDFERFQGLEPTLVKEFRSMLKEFARERRWRPAGVVDVTFAENSELKAGRFEVLTRHLSTEEVPEPDQELDIPVITSASDPDQRWQLDSDLITIGRSSDSGIVLTDPNASRNHAELSKKGEEWWVIDLGSTNGTLVNGALVKERRLQPGDRIKIGGSEMIFELSRKGTDA